MCLSDRLVPLMSAAARKSLHEVSCSFRGGSYRGRRNLVEDTAHTPNPTRYCLQNCAFLKSFGLKQNVLRYFFSPNSLNFEVEFWVSRGQHVAGCWGSSYLFGECRFSLLITSASEPETWRWIKHSGIFGRWLNKSLMEATYKCNTKICHHSEIVFL